ncbi:MAG: InlB B-repeat-containing protein [Paludibacteraceae bacterium]|nr:InlB B-repeat-containing protein [Paludibacteraceae bacterium]
MKTIYTQKRLLIGIKYWSFRSFFLIFALISLNVGQMWGAMYVRGTMNSWGATEMTQSSANSNIYYYKTSGYQEFKVATSTTSWNYGSSAINNSAGYLTSLGGSDNITGGSSGETWYICYNNSTKKVFGVFAMNIAGDNWGDPAIGSWSTSACEMTYDGASIFSKTISTVSAEAHKLKITRCNTNSNWNDARYWSNSSSNISYTNCTCVDDGSNDHNIKFTPYIAGSVTITYNWSTGAITITCPKIPITLNKGTSGTSNGSATVDVGSSTLSTITHATRTDWNLTGYWTAESGGYKVINDDGTLAAYSSNISTYLNSNGTWKKTSATTLYAQWSQSYTVEYNANGGTGTMTDSNSPYANGSTVTTKSNTFTRSYYRFTGWNTKANGSGTSYAAGATFTINANTILYAQWAENMTTVTLAANPTGSGTFTIGGAAATSTTAGKTTTRSITAVPGNGYYLTGTIWSKNNNNITLSSTTANPTTITGCGTNATSSTLTCTFSSRWYLKGGFNDWGTDLPFVFTSATSGYVDVDLSENSSFKLYNAQTNAWYGSEYGIEKGTRETTTLWSDNSNNCPINISGLTGTYRFTIDISGTYPSVTVTFPTINQLRVFTANESSTGDAAIGNWDWTGTSGTVSSKTLTLQAKTQYKFKVVYNSDYYGFKTGSNPTNPMTINNCTDWRMYDDGDDSYLYAPVTGSYTFNFNSDHVVNAKHQTDLSVTFPEASQITFGVGSLGGGGAVTVSPSITSGDYVLKTQAITFTKSATTTAGYTWKGWYDNVEGTGSALGTGNTYTSAANTRTTITEYSFFACYQYASYTVTLDKQTSATGYGNTGTCGNQTVTYNTALPAISGTMPTGSGAYGFYGFYTATGGGGVRVIDESGNWIANVSGYTDADGKWIRTSGVTLYAYYKQAEISALTITPAVIAPSGTVTATPTISPVPGGAAEICWRLLHSNGNIMDSQPTFTSAGGNAVTFTAPETSGTYLVAAILHTGTGCGNGTVLDSVTSGFQVAGDHNVTVQYKCGDVTIQASTTVTGRPLEWTEVVAHEIFGYTFSGWTAGDGVTIRDTTAARLTALQAEDPTIVAVQRMKAIYDGTLTAIYTQNQIIYFKNTLGWSDVYVNFYTGSYWNNPKGSGNYGVTNRNKHMTRIGETDIWYYDYGAASITPSLYVSFTSESQNGSENFWHKSPDVNVVYPANYPDAIHTDKSSENGFKAATPMFVPLASQAAIPLNSSNGGKANYFNAGYWTKYTPGTGYTLEIYYDYDESPTVKSIEFTSEDELMPMKAIVSLEANTTYRYQLRRGGTGDDGIYYGNTGEMTYSNHEAWDMNNSMSPFKKARITTNAAGDYTFNLNYAGHKDATTTYRLRMSVDYPIASGDYRLIYKDGVHTAWHPSAIVPKVNNGKDTVSFFIRPKNANRVLKIQQATVNGSTGAISWEDKSTITSSITSLPQDSVYNINLTMDGSGNISVESVDPYTGNYYIRTDCANSKWDNYRSDPDHRMTYSEYSINHGGYSHYYCHWVEAADAHRKNVKFTIANDYSPCISDTLTRETASGTWANIATFIEANGDILRDANVRFMWDQHTNTISRAYIDGAQGHANDFLVLRSSDSKIADIDNSATILTEVKFLDNQNWIYEANVKAKPNALIKLTSTWGVGTTILQYFKGTESKTETLITGSGSDWYDIRLLYDFKTNRLVAAMVPSGNIEDPTPINADVMFIRDHQGDISQITFTDDGAITNIQTAYGVVRFNKWTLNNKDRETHNPLASPSSRHERGLYFISFPFRVNLEEVFGFGKYGTHWIIQYYDGAARAANGFWEGDPGFWTFIWDRRGVFLEPNQGYLLTLDLDELGESSSVWANNSERAELFFPSYGTMPNITSATVTHSIPAHTCTINWYEQKGIPGSDTGDPRTSYDRRVYDSHWNVMSVPTYVNTNSIAFANTEWTSSGTGKVGPKFLYTWNMDDNTLTATSGSGFTYHAMHAYMVQYNGNVTWTASGSPVSPIVARRTYSEAPKEVEFRLEIQQDDKMIDQTFINMSDDEEVSAGFAFNEDLTKEFNSRKANIYTLINGIMTVAGNTMPMSEQMTIVPVGVTISTTGDYTFAMPDGTDGIGVTLVDNETGIRTSLSALNYTINLEAGDYKERFFLEISPIKNTPTGVETISDEGLEVSGARKVMIDGILYIVKDGRMYDARGARVE